MQVYVQRSQLDARRHPTLTNEEAQALKIRPGSKPRNAIQMGPPAKPPDRQSNDSSSNYTLSEHHEHIPTSNYIDDGQVNDEDFEALESSTDNHFRAAKREQSPPETPSSYPASHESDQVGDFDEQSEPTLAFATDSHGLTTNQPSSTLAQPSASPPPVWGGIARDVEASHSVTEQLHPNWQAFSASQRPSQPRVHNPINTDPPLTELPAACNNTLADQYLDQPLDEIISMPFAALQAQSFDFPPCPSRPTKRPHVDETEHETEPLNDRLETWLATNNQDDQTQFMASLSLGEWNQAGDWIKQRMAVILDDMTRVRQERRLIALEYEKRIAQRSEEIGRLREKTVDILEQIRQNGGSVIPRAASGSDLV